jgi:hypothetical protein
VLWRRGPKHGAVSIGAMPPQLGAVAFGAVLLPLCHGGIHVENYGLKSYGTMTFTNGALTFSAVSQSKTANLSAGGSKCKNLSKKS